jgi:hypothetical protein
MDKSLWEPRLDSSTVGLGVGLGLIANPKLGNLNAMLAVEQPGPQIMVFAKANLLKDPITNKEAAGDLDKGILGLLKIDTKRGELTLAALAELEFAKLIALHAPLEVFASTQQLSEWHVFLGHFRDPITATLKVLGFKLASAKGWFMAAGNEIARAPTSRTTETTLPGLALSLGTKASVQIGGGSLYLRGDLNSYSVVSLSKAFFASADLEIDGELRLFIVSVGATGRLHLEYLHSDAPTLQDTLHISGEACGSFDCGLFSISGCVGLEFGSPIKQPADVPELVRAVRLVAGADVALHGQGQTGPIDEVIADAAVAGSSPVAASISIPLDAVIALNMDVPPRVDAAATGFAHTISRPFENSRFHLGSRELSYLLKGVSLKRQTSTGWQDYSDTPARWGQSGAPSKGGQPVPTTLALLTRDPLAVKNSLPSPDQLNKWLDASMGDVCAPAIAAQRCFYAFTQADRGIPVGGKWALPALLPSSDVERAIGRTGATSSEVTLQRRQLAGTPADPLPGYPSYEGSCQIEADPVSGRAVALLALLGQMVQPNRLVSGSVSISGAMAAQDPMCLLFAYQAPSGMNLCHLRVTSTAGNKDISFVKLLRSNVEDLQLTQVRQSFHQDSPIWKPVTEAFAGLQHAPRLAGFTFRMVTLDFVALGFAPSVVISDVSIELDREIGLGREIELMIGGYRFMPSAEIERYNNDRRAKDHMKQDLSDFLDGKPVPLLEPSSTYRVTVDWEAPVGSGRTRTGAYEFKTTDQPPTSAAPYLLATFPQDRELFHFTASWLLARINRCNRHAREIPRLSAAHHNPGG